MLRFARGMSSGLRRVKVSESEALKSVAMTGPRFEQTDLNLQPNPQPAIDLISKVEILKVDGRKVSCNGGGKNEFVLQTDKNNTEIYFPIHI